LLDKKFILAPPKNLVEGEKVSICNTTSAECETLKTQVTYPVRSLSRECGLVWLKAALDLESRQSAISRGQQALALAIF
jgi:hypothetical protein